jgi:hypothetical protein
MYRCIYSPKYIYSVLVTLIATISGPSFSQLAASGDTTICHGGHAQLSASGGGESYFWYSYPLDSSLEVPQEQNPVVSPNVSTMYVVQSNITTGNLIVNGTFEQGASGFNSEYVNNQLSIETEGTYAVVTDAHLVHPNFFCNQDHTSGTGNFMAINGANITNVKVWYQTLDNIQPNADYEFSSWIASLQTNNPAILQFSINGELMGQPFQVYDSHCFWYQFYHIWNSGTNTQATISIINQDTNISGNDFALDDISFGTVLVYYDTVWVNVLPQFNSHFNWQAAACEEEVTEVYYTGNAPVTSNFHWNFGDAIVMSGSGTGPYEIKYLTPGIHFLSLWVDGEGCASNTTTHSVNVGEEPSAGVSADNQVLIYDSFTTLHGSYSGSPGPFTFSWSPAELLVDPGIINPQTIPMEVTTAFILTVTDQATGCIGFDSVVVEVTDGPLGAYIFANPVEICPGEHSVLTAQGTGGAKSYTYSWISDPPGFTSDLKTVTVEPYVTTVYTVIVDDGLNSAIDTITVTVDPQPVSNAGSDENIPYGTFAYLQGTGFGGAGDDSYHWEPAQLVINPDSANTQTVNLTTTTIFSLVVTNLPSGCVSEPDEVMVNIVGGPLSVVIHPDRPSICRGDTAILTAYASGGNQGNYTYTWSDNLGNSYPSTAQIMVFPADTLEFHVEVNDGFNSAEGFYTLIVHPSAEFSWFGGQDIIKACPFDTVILKPETLPATWDYLWSNGWTGDQITALVTGIGHNIQNYTLTVMNEDGCTFSRSAAIIFDFSVCSGIGEDHSDESIKIMPNPNNGKFRVLLSDTGNFTEILIFSPLAGKVFEKSIEGIKHEIEIDLHQLPAGLYILYLKGPSVFLTRKIIIRP